MSESKDIVFAVVADTGGAHEAECIYSVWTTREQAQVEIYRLRTVGVDPGCYDGDWSIAMVPVNCSSDVWIPW